MFERYSHNCKKALTLVEAMLGMALLGTLLVSILVAAGRINVQSRRVKKRVEAYRLADGLLTQWWSDKSNFPRNDSGDLKGHENWKWRTRSITDPAEQAINVDLVSLEIIDESQGVSLARIEIILPGVERQNEADSNDIN